MQFLMTAYNFLKNKAAFLNTGTWSKKAIKEAKIFGKVDVLCGANIFIEKNKFNELGKFNEKYFMYGEDIELSVKSKLKGYDNYYFGKNSIIHFKGESNDDYLNYNRHCESALVQ